jgi:hypothetical protein
LKTAKGGAPSFVVVQNRKAGKTAPQPGLDYAQGWASPPNANVFVAQARTLEETVPEV